MEDLTVYKAVLQQYLFDIVLFDYLKEKASGISDTLSELSHGIEQLAERLFEVKLKLGFDDAMPFLTDELPFIGFNVGNHKVTGDREKAVSWASDIFWKFCSEPEDNNLLFETAVFVLAYFELN